MNYFAERLDRVLKAAGLPIVGVSIGDPADKTTWAVQPDTLQTSAQPHIDAFDPDDPAFTAAALDAEVKAAIDSERLISSVVWCILETYSPPATPAKYQAARTRIINAYKTRPWAS